MNCFRFCMFALAALSATASAQLQGNLLLREPPAQAPFVSTINRIITNPATAKQSSGMGSLVTVGGTGWNVSNIQTYISQFPTSQWYGNVNRAMLTVSLQEDGVPDAAHDPVGPSSGLGILFSGIVPVTTDSKSGNFFRLMTDTTTIEPLQGLAPGDYVFSLTAFDDNLGPAFTVRAANPQQHGYIRNTQGAFNWWWGNDDNDPTAWGTLKRVFTTTGTHDMEDWAIGINGTMAPVPEPATMAVLGCGLSFIVARRKRKGRPARKFLSDHGPA